MYLGMVNRCNVYMFPFVTRKETTCFAMFPLENQSARFLPSFQLSYIALAVDSAIEGATFARVDVHTLSHHQNCSNHTTQALYSIITCQVSDISSISLKIRRKCGENTNPVYPKHQLPRSHSIPRVVHVCVLCCTETTQQ